MTMEFLSKKLIFDI